jgi:Flp pilus assembly protein TadG
MTGIDWYQVISIVSSLAAIVGGGLVIKIKKLVTDVAAVANDIVTAELDDKITPDEAKKIAQDSAQVLADLKLLTVKNQVLS